MWALVLILFYEFHDYMILVVEFSSTVHSYSAGARDEDIPFSVVVVTSSLYLLPVKNGLQVEILPTQENVKRHTIS